MEKKFRKHKDYSLFYDVAKHIIEKAEQDFKTAEKTAKDQKECLGETLGSFLNKLHPKNTDGKQCGRNLDIVLTGATGAGKSSTINAFFHKTLAKVNDYKPETKEIMLYEYNDRIRLWDTPGLGDGVSEDETHTRKIKSFITSKHLIESHLNTTQVFIIVILEATRDIGTVTKLVKNVLLPAVDYQHQHILFAINKADMCMCGRYWDDSENAPCETLLNELEKKAVSLQERLRRDIGITMSKPIYYSADKGYNIDQFFSQFLY